jgi:hypothetical protein
MKRVIGALFVASLVGAVAQAQSLPAPFSSDYTLNDLGSIAGVPGPYGGITFLNDNTLLIGGSANSGGGAIYAVSVTRDINGNITGFGTPTLYSTAPNIDGGLAFGPGGDLFFTEFPNNAIGEIMPGDNSPDLTVSLSGNVTSSVGTLAFVPAGFNGAGNFVIGSYSGGTFCTASLTANGSGTYNIGTCSGTETTGGGPEGIIYVPSGSADFSGEMALVSQYSTGTVVAYGIDANGLPTGAGTTFINGLSGAEGAVLDPVTDDFLFSTFGGGNQIEEVQGFSAPIPSTPEPAAFFLMGGGLAAVIALRRRLRAC